VNVARRYPITIALIALVLVSALDPLHLSSAPSRARPRATRN
jgi:hypothetical protein